MPLLLREKLTLLLPPTMFYRRRIAEEARAGEPELAVLPTLMRPGGTAVDVGANQGLFSFALSAVAERVVAFEPNPDYAFFARVMLRGRATVHPVALSDEAGRATFHVPSADDGMVLHFAGSLKGTHSQFQIVTRYEVEVRTLDQYALADVRFIKVDVEGSEREVLDGARATIARDRPVLLLELLSGTHPAPGAIAAGICEDFGYEAFLVQDGEKIPALPAIAALGTNTSWNSAIESRNVLFTPR
jgi:FkbM family methyltransferase